MIFILNLVGVSVAQVTPDFDSSRKNAPFELKASLAGVRTPEIKATVEVKTYVINCNADGSVYDWSQEAGIKANGKGVEQRLKAAGYAVLSGDVVKRSWGQGSYDYNLEYVVVFALPAGCAAESIKNYSLLRDAAYAPYGSSDDYRIRADGKIIEERLKTAGYVILTSQLFRRPGGQGSFDYNLEYYIDYLAPAGRASARIQDYSLLRDAVDAPYDWTKEYEIKADAKIIEERLKAAGYIIISSKLYRRQWGQNSYEYNLEYDIEYLPPVGYQAEAIQRYEILRDEENKPYDLSEGYRLNAAGKAMEGKLTAAGNIILRSQTYQTQSELGYSIEYLMPLGGTAAEILSFELWKGRDGQFYTGLSGKSQAETDGKGMVGNLKAAGYVILEAKLVQAGNEDRWGYSIRYVRPVI